MTPPFSTDSEYRKNQRERTNKLLDEFNPNAQSHEWATYIPDRHPDFKLHKSKGTALSAFQYGRPGVLYVHDEKWLEVARVEDRTADNCDNCGGTLWKQFGSSKPYHRAEHVWIGDPEYKMVQLCQDCGHRIRRTGPTDQRRLERY